MHACAGMSACMLLHDAASTPWPACPHGWHWQHAWDLPAQVCLTMLHALCNAVHTYPSCEHDGCCAIAFLSSIWRPRCRASPAQQMKPIRAAQAITLGYLHTVHAIQDARPYGRPVRRLLLQATRRSGNNLCSLHCGLVRQEEVQGEFLWHGCGRLCIIHRLRDEVGWKLGRVQRGRDVGVELFEELCRQTHTDRLLMTGSDFGSGRGALTMRFRRH